MGQRGQTGTGWLGSERNPARSGAISTLEGFRCERLMWAHLFHRTNNLIGKGHVKEKNLLRYRTTQKNLMLSCSHSLIYSSSYTVPLPQHPSACQSATCLSPHCLCGRKKGTLSPSYWWAAEAERLRARSSYLNIGFRCHLRCPGACKTRRGLAGRTQVLREIHGLVEARQGMLAHCRGRGMSRFRQLNWIIKSRQGICGRTGSWTLQTALLAC